MDFIRSRVSGRGNPTAGQDADLEQAGVSERGQLQGQQETGRGRFGIRRPQVSSIVTNQSSGVNRLQRRTVSGENEDGPKTPRFHLGLPSLPSGRFQFPSLSRIGTRKRSRSSLSREQGQQPSDGSEPRISLQQSQAGQSAVVAEPQPTHVQGDPSSGSSMRSFRGADPAEMHSAGLAETGRRRRHRTNPSESQQGGKPRKFLYCFPWIKSRRVRSQILRCFVSGMFLLMFLVIYLALSVTQNIKNSEFTILLILIILFITIFFCHGLIRLCMIIVRPKTSDAAERERLPEMVGPGGYAVPRRPIRVLLARDEEAAGLESETIKLQPPAYGLWRESVRVDPNRIYWQRNDQTTPSTIDEETAPRPVTANRPPSYASDDGVEYAVEPRPRSMAPGALLADVPLPTHPSEVGREGHHPTF